jgi:hypothetical protein
MVRAQSFFGQLYNDPEMLAQHMDGLHFLTESLLQLWKVIDNNHIPSARNPALKALYASAQEAKNYENIMKSDVFDVVSANCITSHNFPSFFFYFSFSLCLLSSPSLPHYFLLSLSFLLFCVVVLTIPY